MSRAVSGAVLLVMLVARAEAGPWCGGDTLLAPLPGAVLPKHPRLVHAIYETRYAGKKQLREAVPITATLDGRPVKLAIREAQEGPWLLRFIEVMSPEAGALEVTVGEGSGADKASYTLSDTWKAPDQATATVGRFKIGTAEMQQRHYEGIALEVAVPAVSFVVRWRRDRRDAWRTFETPAETLHTRKPAVPVAKVGQTRCGVDTIPLALLEQGVELELRAKLPDGSKLTIDGIPQPLVLPPAAPRLPSAAPEHEEELR